MLFSYTTIGGNAVDGEGVWGWGARLFLCSVVGEVF